jgi:hypothetical protein
MNHNRRSDDFTCRSLWGYSMTVWQIQAL